MYPTTFVVTSSSFAADDSVVAKVTRIGTSYTLSATASALITISGIPPFYNVVSFFNTSQTCSSCANSSAEWIAQAPKTSSGSRYPLAQFSPWSISNADVANYLVSATAPPVGISSFPDTQITMANSSGTVLAQPGALNSSGNGFTVTWQQSS